MSRLVSILPAAFAIQNIPDGIDKYGIISIEVTNVSHRRKFQKIVLDWRLICLVCIASFTAWCLWACGGHEGKPFTRFCGCCVLRIVKIRDVKLLVMLVSLRFNVTNCLFRGGISPQIQC